MRESFSPRYKLNHGADYFQTCRDRAVQLPSSTFQQKGQARILTSIKFQPTLPLNLNNCVGSIPTCQWTVMGLKRHVFTSLTRQKHLARPLSPGYFQISPLGFSSGDGRRIQSILALTKSMRTIQLRKKSLSKPTSYLGDKTLTFLMNVRCSNLNSIGKK